MASYQPSHKKSALRRWIVGITATLVVGIGLVTLFRADILEHVLISVAKREGIGDLVLEVDQVTLSEITLSSLTLADGALAAKTVSVTYAPAALLKGKVDHIAVDGLTIRGAWTEGGISFGLLDGLVADQMNQSGGRANSKLPFNQLEVSDIQLNLAHPDRLITVKADVLLNQSASGLALSATSRVEGPSLEASLDISGNVDPANVLQASLEGTLNFTAIDFNVPGVRAPLSANADLGLKIDEGLASFRSDDEVMFSAPWPAALGPAEDPAAIIEFVLRGHTEGAPLLLFSLDGNNVRTEIDLNLSAETPRGRGQAYVQGWGVFEPSWLPQEFSFERLELQIEDIQTPFGLLSASLSANDFRGPNIDLLAPVTIEGNMENARVGEFSFTELGFAGQTTIKLDGQSLHAHLDRFSGQLEGGRYETFLELGEPVSFSLAAPGVAEQNAQLTFTSDQASNASIDIALRAEIPKISIAQENSPLFISAGMPALALQGTWDGFGSEPSFTASASGAEVGTDWASVEDLNITLSGQPARFSGPMTASLLPPRVSTAQPIASLTGNISYADNIFNYEGLMQLISGVELSKFDLTYDLGAQSGDLDAQIGPVEFGGSEGITPTDLRPLALPITPTAGEFAASLKLPLGSNSNTSQHVSIYIKDMEAEASSYAIRRLNTAIELQSLWPPQTDGPQNIAIGLLQAGVPVTNVQATFDLPSQEDLDILELSMNFAEGQLRGGPFSVSLVGQNKTINLDVSDVSLPTLAELSTLDGLEATGQLSGRIPLKITEQGVEIESGQLTTGAPGYIRYRPGQAVGAMASPNAEAGGMNLALQALENFQYDAITVTVSGSVLKELDASLAIKGRNPDLYNGYPIDFNLNLSGELANVIQGSLAGYRVPETIKRQLLAFPPEP